MKIWSAFYPFIIPLVRNCPGPVVDNALREAAREFCNTSLVWEILDEVDGDIEPVDLPTPANAELVQLLKVSTPTRVLSPTRERALDGIAAWETLEGTEPSVYYCPTPGTIGFFPGPTAGVTVSIRAAYRPGLNATGVEDFIFENWRHAITIGALSILKAMANESWYDPMSAERNGQLFCIASGKARAQKSMGYQYGALRVTPVRC